MNRKTMVEAESGPAPTPVTPTGIHLSVEPVLYGRETISAHHEDTDHAAELRRRPTGPVPRLSSVRGGAVDQKEGEVVRFRPTLRPPTPALCILDDGRKDTGEWIRMRQERLVIGRTEGDVLIPHDDAISRKHAELSLVLTDGAYRLWLKDLKSTNGTFVRVGEATVNPLQEFMIGTRRFHYRLVSRKKFEDRKKSAESSGDSSGFLTLNEDTPPPDDPKDAITLLTEILPNNKPNEYQLKEAEVKFGTDPKKVDVELEGDPFVEPFHATLRQHNDGRWSVVDQNSTNGVWLRVESQSIRGKCEFQLGEQRFFVTFR